MQRCPKLINFVLTVYTEAVGTELAQLSPSAHTHQCGALQLPEASSWVPCDPPLCFTPSSMGACSKANINFSFSFFFLFLHVCGELLVSRVYVIKSKWEIGRKQTKQTLLVLING